MKVILMALAAAGFISSTSALLADTPVTPAEEEKVKAALEAFGCTVGKIEKEDADSACPTKSMPRGASAESMTSSSIRIST
jgi:hypothetical protein